jgi:hypothetical protein
MNAWLVTLQPISPNSKVTHPVIAIFSLHKSMKFVSEFVQQYHLMASLTGRSVLYCINRRGTIISKVRCTERINDIPHLDRIRCGDDPFIYARKVSELEVEEDGNMQVFRWREPPTMRFNKTRMQPEIDKPGDMQELRTKLDALIPIPYKASKHPL